MFLTKDLNLGYLYLKSRFQLSYSFLMENFISLVYAPKSNYSIWFLRLRIWSVYNTRSLLCSFIRHISFQTTWLIMTNSGWMFLKGNWFLDYHNQYSLSLYAALSVRWAVYNQTFTAWRPWTMRWHWEAMCFVVKPINAGCYTISIIIAILILISVGLPSVLLQIRIE
jgi:hypothetical protein